MTISTWSHNTCTARGQHEEARIDGDVTRGGVGCGFLDFVELSVSGRHLMSSGPDGEGLVYVPERVQVGEGKTGDIREVCGRSMGSLCDVILFPREARIVLSLQHIC